MLFGLGFCWFSWVSIGFERNIFFVLFFVEIFDTVFYGFRDFGIVTVLIFLVLWDYL